jgi:phenylpropionate dioxygenase-like ring-hydroxylating dioxygenase large terminal subunit
MTSAVQSDVVSRLIGHLTHSTTDLAPDDLMVPVSNFTSAERAEQERRVLHRRPLVVGHHSELAGPGAFLTREVLGTPVILVRRADGSVTGYVNMCLHRGGVVEDEAAGTRRIFTCKYHGWSYESETGALEYVPHESFFGPIDRSCNGLEKVTVFERHGLLWVDLSGATADLGDYLGPEVEQQLTDLGLDESVMLMDESFPLPINWKLIMDGGTDLLHPKFLHPTTVGRMRAKSCSAWNDYGLHGQMYVPRRRMADLIADGGAVTADWRMVSSMLRLHPNSMVMCPPDHVEFWTVWPGPDRADYSVTTIRVFARPDRLDDRLRERVQRSWEILMQASQDEDWPMEETIQRNSLARPDRFYRYGRAEIAMQHFHETLERDVRELTS